MFKFIRTNKSNDSDIIDLLQAINAVLLAVGRAGWNTTVYI